MPASENKPSFITSTAASSTCGLGLFILTWTVTGAHWSTCIFLSILSYGGHLLFINSIPETPVLHLAPGKFRDFVDKYIPSIHSEYRPVPWFIGGVTSTILTSYIREGVEASVSFRREILKLPDGGAVALDWLDAESDSSCNITVLFLPGLTGNSDAGYLRTPIKNAFQDGARCVVFNNRGQGGVPLATPRTYCAANTDDLQNVVAHIRKKYPETKIIGLGFSMGGMLLTHLVSGGSSDPNLHNYFLGVMIVSSPWDASLSDEALSHGLNQIFTWNLAKGLVDSVKSHRNVLEGTGPWDFQKTLQSATIKEFDVRFTIHQFGFQDVNEYYKVASLTHKIPHMKVPLIALNAEDDPFLPSKALPYDETDRSLKVALVSTRRGGHLGFLEGFWPFKEKMQHLPERIFREYFLALKSHGLEI